MNTNDAKKKKSISNLLYAIKSYFSVQANVLIVFFAILLLVLTIYPMYSVIRSAVTVGKMEAMRYNTLLHTNLHEGDLTLLNFQALLTNENTFWKPLWSPD